MSGRLYKATLALAAAALFVGVSFAQWSLVRERDTLGLNRYPELKGAPPVLMLTTVVLGGFRGLISNALWIRANELQEQDKFFEMVQLADWITKLEPTFAQVWAIQGWNMAFNITVKFKEPEDRWRWVDRGIQLLRDDGLRYNPYDVLIHRELAWIYLFKMGGNMDDAHLFYKWELGNEMRNAFGGDRPNWDELLNPRTDEARKRVQVLREKHKLEPQFMKELDDRYGPLEWRLPEAHAIYWSARGLEEGKKNEKKIDPDTLIQVRREIYQAMLLSFHRGRLLLLNTDRTNRQIDFGPNLAIIPKVDKAYRDLMEEDPRNADHIQIAHRNFLLDAVFYLHMYNRTADALVWYKFLGELYPDKHMLERDPKSLPSDLSLNDYALARMQQELGTLAQDDTQAMLEGLERQAFISLAEDDDERSVSLHGYATQIYARYQEKITGPAEGRLQVPPLETTRQRILNELLTGTELPVELRARLATKTGVKIPETPAAAATNIIR